MPVVVAPMAGHQLGVSKPGLVRVLQRLAPGESPGYGRLSLDVCSGLGADRPLILAR